MEVLIVIPNTFNKFSQNENLLSYDKLLDLLNLCDPSTSELAGCRLIAGQGLDDMQVDHAWYLATSRGLASEFTHWRIARNNRPAALMLCHKHQPQNTLISTPEQQPDGSFTACFYMSAMSSSLIT